jgi:hypothetical protein
MRAEGLTPRAIVVSEREPGPVPAEETAETIARFAGSVPVRVVPRGGTVSLRDLF